jgi:hypothetical protein
MHVWLAAAANRWHCNYDSGLIIVDEIHHKRHLEKSSESFKRLFETAAAKQWEHGNGCW